MTMVEVAGGVLVVLGAALVAVGGVGLVRFPDAYTRMNAVTKAATLGVVLVMAGVLCLMPSWPAAGALLLAAGLQLFTSPVGGYALASAAYRTGTPLADATLYDELAESDEEHR